MTSLHSLKKSITEIKQMVLLALLIFVVILSVVLFFLSRSSPLRRNYCIFHEQSCDDAANFHVVVVCTANYNKIGGMGVNCLYKYCCLHGYQFTLVREPVADLHVNFTKNKAVLDLLTTSNASYIVSIDADIEILCYGTKLSDVIRDTPPEVKDKAILFAPADEWNFAGDRGNIINTGFTLWKNCARSKDINESMQRAAVTECREVSSCKECPNKDTKYGPQQATFEKCVYPGMWAEELVILDPGLVGVQWSSFIRQTKETRAGWVKAQMPTEPLSLQELEEGQHTLLPNILPLFVPTSTWMCYCFHGEPMFCELRTAHSREYYSVAGQQLFINGQTSRRQVVLENVLLLCRQLPLDRPYVRVDVMADNNEAGWKVSNLVYGSEEVWTPVTFEVLLGEFVRDSSNLSIEKVNAYSLPPVIACIIGCADIDKTIASLQKQSIPPQQIYCVIDSEQSNKKTVHAGITWIEDRHPILIPDVPYSTYLTAVCKSGEVYAYNWLEHLLQASIEHGHVCAIALAGIASDHNTTHSMFVTDSAGSISFNKGPSFGLIHYPQVAAGYLLPHMTDVDELSHSIRDNIDYAIGDFFQAHNIHIIHAVWN